MSALLLPVWVRVCFDLLQLPLRNLPPILRRTAVESLDRRDVQRSELGGLHLGIASRVAHHGVLDIVDARTQQFLVVIHLVKGVLEPERVADLMKKHVELVGRFSPKVRCGTRCSDRRFRRRIPDPVVPGAEAVAVELRKLRPGARSGQFQCHWNFSSASSPLTSRNRMPLASPHIFRALRATALSALPNFDESHTEEREVERVGEKNGLLCRRGWAGRSSSGRREWLYDPASGKALVQ